MRQAALIMVPVLVAVAAMFPCLAGWKVLGGADQSGIWYPFMEYAQQTFARDGTVALWLPSLFGGLPFEESMVPGIYYPTDIICWLTGIKPPIFYAYDICLHLALAGAGTALLARALGTSTAAAIFGGIAYMLGGYIIEQVKGGTMVFIRAAGLYPWIFWSLFRALQNPTLKRWSVVAISLALLPLAAAYQPLAYMCILLPFFILLVSGQAGRIKSLGALAGAGAFSGVLAAATIMPAFRYFLNSIRSVPGESWKDVDPYSLNILTLFIPESNPPWQLIYLGFIPALLAITGMILGRKTSWPWAVIGIITVFFSLGTQTPVGQALGHLPLFGAFRGSGHWIGLVSLAMALLAAIGFTAVFGTRKILPVVALVLLGSLTTVDLMRQSRPLANASKWADFEASRPSRDPLVWFLSHQAGIFRTHTCEAHVFPNMRIPTGLEWIGGYHGAPLALFKEFYDTTMGACPEIPWLFAWLNTKYFIVGRNQQMRGFIPIIRFSSLTTGQVTVCENPLALPRIFFGKSAEPAEGIPVMQRLCSEPPDRRRLYVHSRAGEFPSGRLPAGTVLSEKHSPNRIEAEVQSGGKGMVFFSEAFFPAWTAFVDGQRVRLHRVNVLFRGVAVEKGRHSIVMSYQSIPFKLGLFLSFLGWTMLALFWVPAWRRQ